MARGEQDCSVTYSLVFSGNVNYVGLRVSKLTTGAAMLLPVFVDASANVVHTPFARRCEIGMPFKGLDSAVILLFFTACGIAQHATLELQQRVFNEVCPRDFVCTRGR